MNIQASLEISRTQQLLIEGLPSLDESVLDSLNPLTEEELGLKLEDLSAIVINRPDDQAALANLRQVIGEIRDSGSIDAAMQVAMTLGAMACLHDHMQGIANEAGDIFGLDAKLDSGDQHNHTGYEDHDKSKCKNCKSGRHCAKKH